ncbi:MAG: aminomethyl-transferring glycine dehydrogenase [Candidatus Marinimicrobia bacterium]|nr:aminomethyl-transferring glycine dehydrogenase [Candidatus Neomarinimicrobiota bacterium]|tara:strand:- start:13230 stop:14573 length:1344 start_codon:yes stop_codon:yes gene_type:complete
MAYSPITDNDVKEMLNKIKLNSLDELFNIVPDKFKLDFDKFDIPKGLSEQEVYAKLSEIGEKNSASKNDTFIGGGAYDHYVPTVVDFLSSRSEFYTAYTPYQPEVSQGTLQYLYEFQSMICELSGMDISNASLYDGASAVAEACSMSIASNRKKKIVISSSVNPEYISVVKSYFSYNGITVDFSESENGVTNSKNLLKSIDSETSCVVVQSPNYYGLLEDLEAICELKSTYPDLLVICVSDPMSLSLIKSPGDCGCDVYVGEGQSLGNYLSFGGPYIGLFAAKEKYVRKMPGRIIGRTVDVDGKEGFVMTLQTREQHIRRERATSNICTNQGLIALRCTIYLSLLGKHGLVNIAKRCFENTQYAADQISTLDNFSLKYESKNFIKEFLVSTSFSVKNLIEDAGQNGFNISALKNDDSDSLFLLAFTEKYPKDKIDSFVKYLKNYKES